ncbi:MAG: response regulator [Desulfotignum sp.]|nr:response regulator [Desulfotignum sp.]MCF8088447.1 response regulator [Desulfotignum sp.]MCF8136448.1 response regulator [Desulfotignum sp.]
MAYRVLVVDDSSSIRAIIKKIIKVSGFDVGGFLDACDGREALTVMAANQVDLVLTDINMPNMNGLELIARIKENHHLASVPVVVVSTEGSEKKMAEAMSLGAVGYVKKPFVPEEIKQTLNKILEVGSGNAGLDDDDEDVDF